MTKDTSHHSSRLEHLPVSLFAITMGLAGLTIATHKIESLQGIHNNISIALLGITAIVWLMVSLLYGAKFLFYPHAVIAEWRHPVRLSFFPASTIGLILLSIAAAPNDAAYACMLWWMGASGHLLMTLTVMGRWINQECFEIHHSNPAWFIPVVGNILVPIVGVEFAPVDVSWFFFAIGLVFWLVLLTIIFNRIIFHSPMPGKLMPTLAILLAPPSVGFLAWFKLVGQVDAFAHILYGVAAFFFLLLIMQVPKLSRLGFALSWWAYTFPVAAFTVATMVMGQVSHNQVYVGFGQGLYVLLLVVIGLVTVRTGIAIWKNEICIPE